MKRIERIAPLLGRTLLSAIFLMSGFNKITGWSAAAGYMASKQMPAVPFFLAMAILFELAGGISVITGYKARFGALLLLVFLIPTTLIFHNFWAAEAAQQQNQMIHFLKNVSIMGGLLVIIGLGPGPLSLAGPQEPSAGPK